MVSDQVRASNTRVRIIGGGGGIGVEFEFDEISRSAIERCTLFDTIGRGGLLSLPGPMCGCWVYQSEIHLVSGALILWVTTRKSRSPLVFFGQYDRGGTVRYWRRLLKLTLL